MKNIVLILSFIISSFCVFAQRNSATDTVTVNPKYKAADSIVKNDLPHHQQKRNTADSSDKTANIRICTPSRANVIPPLTIVNYGNKVYKSTDSKKGGVLNIINPNYIAAISVLKDTVDTKK